jgi:DNA polymerase V
MMTDVENTDTYDSRLVASGFPTAADDYMDRGLDLHEYMVLNPLATYFMRAGSTEYIAEGIYQGDLLVVDRSEQPKVGRLAVVKIDGDLAIRRIAAGNGELVLVKAGSPTLSISKEGANRNVIWGIITHVIHELILRD